MKIDRKGKKKHFPILIGNPTFILHSFPCSSLFLSKVRISPKVTIACNGFCLLRHTKTWLARDIISYSGTMFSRVLYYIVNFEIIALDK